MNAAPQTEPQTHTGEWMYAFIERAYPECRSITGDGLRRTLAMISELIPLEISEVQTGTRVLDWEIPKEWNIHDAWVADSSGHRLIDFREHNLHVVNYSVPVRRRMRFEELRPKLPYDARASGLDSTERPITTRIGASA
ncbi:MAG: DUF4910 domain-containing protein [Bryobacterales bacterium]